MAEFGVGKKDVDVKLPRAAAVKNKQPSEQQITAEQIIREAKSIQV